MNSNIPSPSAAMLVAQRRFRAPRLLSLAALIAPLAMAQTTVRIDLSKPGIPVSPTLYGLMTEEINFSYDGGLYAELVRNRVFKDDSNTIAEPTKVVPVTSKASGLGKQFSYSFAPYSVTVLVLSIK